MKTYRQQSGQQKYNEECERLIIEALPKLRGQFTALRLWDDLNYCYLWNKSIPEAVAAIVERFKH